MIGTNPTTPATRVAFLGLGSMNGAILAGYLAAGADPSSITATVHTQEKAGPAAEKYGVEVVATGADAEANQRAVSGADIVVLGVKPQGILELCRQISPALDPTTVVVSVAAGVTQAAIEKNLPVGQPVVRTMPNTPLTVGSGVVGVAAGPTVSAEQLAAVNAVFAESGLVIEVPEEQLSTVVAAAGSAPAYVFLLAELIAAHAAQMGLDADDAEAMAAATVKGAGLMLTRGEESAETLRKNVMSPGGTTEKAVEAFFDGGLPDLVARAMDAAAARDREMGQEFAD